MRRPGLVTGLAAVIALSLAGCSGESPTALSSGAARRLQADVLVVTTSVAAHNWVGARSELQTLRADLASARLAGTVSAVRAASIEAAIAAVSADLAGAVPSTVPSTPPSVRTTPTPSPSAATSIAKHKPPKGPKHG